MNLEAADSGLTNPPLSPAEHTADFVLRHLRARGGKLWRGSRIQGAPRFQGHELEALDARTLLRTYQLKGVARDSQAGLVGWLEGRYPLDLRFDIPTPLEMLDIQCRGRRYVTLLANPEEQFKQYGRHAGALEFLLHDLEHAHKYFGDPHLTRGQRRFFQLLRKELPRLHAFAREEEQFHGELNYLMADMNSHPVHLLKYLKAVILNASLRDPRRPGYEDFCAGLFAAWGMPLEVRKAADRTNSPGEETAEDQANIADWFLNSIF